jgi:hypothetical protein
VRKLLYGCLVGVFIASSAHADWHEGYRGNHRTEGWWLLPAFIGSTVAYLLARPAKADMQPANPVYIERPSESDQNPMPNDTASIANKYFCDALCIARPFLGSEGEKDKAQTI